jgi:RNA polymerase sigma-70 factor (ECF subfamily)
MGNDYTDEDLMLMYRDGDASAFEILYRRHKGPVYRFILRRCGNTGVAEELFQDVWVKLIQARERYAVSARFTTYLYRIAHNRLIDHFRKSKTDFSSDGAVDADQLPAPVQLQPERRAETGQQARILVDAIAGLPGEQQQVFLLKEEAGMNIPEIAEVLGVNGETVKSRLRYAVKKLRIAMGEIDDRA